VDERVGISARRESVGDATEMVQRFELSGKRALGGRTYSSAVVEVKDLAKGKVGGCWC
jgi:hypothetical protein